MLKLTILTPTVFISDHFEQTEGKLYHGPIQRSLPLEAVLALPPLNVTLPCLPSDGPAPPYPVELLFLPRMLLSARPSFWIALPARAPGSRPLNQSIW